MFEFVYVTTADSAFCLTLYLTGVHFRGELQHVGQVSEQKNQMPTNQNSRNRWCQIVRRAIWHIIVVSSLRRKST